MSVGSTGLRFGGAALFMLGLVAIPPAQVVAENLPSYMNVIVAGPSFSAADTAQQDVLALNQAMFDRYEASGAILRKNLLEQHPVILRKVQRAALIEGATSEFPSSC